jgi:diadenosine tetraphosphate (Ap4A) HIT family hydrolase
MFELNTTLVADTIPVTDWQLCRVLLARDANYPWLILVPRRHGVTEIHELDECDRHLLMDEIATATHKLQNLTGAHKMNVAALGNVVPQLHVHVVARFTSDPAWPRPVWGVVPSKPYTDAELTRMLEALV